MSWYSGMSDFLFGRAGTAATANTAGTAGTSGAFAPILGAGLNYYQQDEARKDKLKMFDKNFNAEQDQLKFQNNEYLAKRDAEKDAWGGFGQAGNPYQTII